MMDGIATNLEVRGPERDPAGNPEERPSDSWLDVKGRVRRVGMPSRSRGRGTIVGLGCVLAVTVVSLWPENASAATQAKVIFHKNRAFRIPVTIPKEAKDLVREVRLWISDDSGFTWKDYARTTPDSP